MLDVFDDVEESNDAQRAIGQMQPLERAAEHFPHVVSRDRSRSICQWFNGNNLVGPAAGKSLGHRTCSGSDVPDCLRIRGASKCINHDLCAVIKPIATPTVEAERRQTCLWVVDFDVVTDEMHPIDDRAEHGRFPAELLQTLQLR